MAQVQPVAAGIVANTTANTAEEEVKEPPIWPRPFSLNADLRTPENAHWSHKLYQGPNNEVVQVTLCTTKEQSEIAAQIFLGEELVGFDMEWIIDYRKHDQKKTPRPLQDEISMIQVATETHIALFHIGQHRGSTSEELIAPSLRKIIESPTIIKTGHNIMSADCSRLKQFFNIHPKAIFELCHLDYLVNHGPTDPQRVNTNSWNTSLGNMVHQHLGITMCKDDDIRKCNWRKRLNEDWALDKKKLTYAAADAYSGPMLYHCMNAKRLAMNPVPPLPLLADSYLPFRKPRTEAIRLQSNVEGKAYITAIDVFPPKVEVKVNIEQTTTSCHEHTTTTALNVTVNAIAAAQPTISTDGVDGKQAPQRARHRAIDDALDATAILLFNQLMKCRDDLGAKHNKDPRMVTSELALKKVAISRPSNKAGLKTIRGIGEITIERYGEELLKVVADFESGGVDESTVPVEQKAAKPKKEKEPKAPLVGKEHNLFQALRAKRMEVCRGEGVQAYVIAHDTVLESLARTRPLTIEALLDVKGIGKFKAEKYGNHWLGVIQKFVKEHKLEPAGQQAPQISTVSPAAQQAPAIPVTPDRNSRRRNDSTVTRAPQLSTGLSFNFSQATLEPEPEPEPEPPRTPQTLTDDLIDFDIDQFFTPPSRPLSASGIKRKRSVDEFS